MEQPRATPPPWLPAARQPVPPPAVPPPSDGKGPPDPAPGPRFNWRKLARSPRGAAGLAVLAAALLLWPFSGLSWIPWLAGLGALVILRLLRLDGLLRGWDIPLAGLVVVIGLMWSTGPWAWALAASIGVLLAGLAQLPWWRLAAIGAVMCVVSGVGFGFDTYRSVEAQKQIEAHAGDQLRSQLGETRPARVLPALLDAVRLSDADPVCRLLNTSAQSALLGATQAVDCPAAVRELHRRAPNIKSATPDSLPQPQAVAGGWQVDACRTPWAEAAGPSLGRISITQTSPNVQRFAVAGLSPC